ncbi:MAG: efflux RND transporter periplasmic adaptor subunit, partial [Acidobacteriota bacterium]|nr:efflux RND transporter periplasmic adaptor subunit [Acidobacteriota bacterium]
MKKVLLVVALLGLVGAGAGAYYLRHTGPGLQVNTAAVTAGPVVDTVAATGALQAVTTVQVGSQVSGNIRALKADFNSIVRRGQVIAELDPSLFEAQLQQAKANLLKSQSDVERLRVTVEDSTRKLRRAEQLFARHLIAESDLEAAQVELKANQAQLQSSQAQVEQARASLTQSQVDLNHTIISAPIDGIVISRNVDVGQTVAASFQSPTLFVIAADLTKMQVNANIDEADIGRIRPGQRVRFRVDAYPAEEFIGTVSQIRLQPVVVQNVTTYATVIDVPNPQLKLKPGMTANVNVEVASRDHAVRVPNTALRFRPTVDMFAALNQAVPPELEPRARPGDGRPGAGGPGGRRMGAP